MRATIVPRVFGLMLSVACLFACGTSASPASATSPPPEPTALPAPPPPSSNAVVDGAADALGLRLAILGPAEATLDARYVNLVAPADGADPLPAPPRVALTLRIENTSAATRWVRTGRDGDGISLALSGPGVVSNSPGAADCLAVSHLGEWVEVAAGGHLDVPSEVLETAPGRCGSTPLFWTMPGTYEVSAVFTGATSDVDPVSLEAREDPTSVSALLEAVSAFPRSQLSAGPLSILVRPPG